MVRQGSLAAALASVKDQFEVHSTDHHEGFAAAAPSAGRRHVDSAVSFYNLPQGRNAQKHAEFFVGSPALRFHRHTAFADTFTEHPMVNFEASEASSTYGKGPMFSAEQALKPGKYYWASAGKHSDTETVTWTGVLPTRRQVAGVRIKWPQEYSPNEMKVLTSNDGEHFEENGCWKTIGTDQPEFNQTVTFDYPRNVKAMSVVMRKPGKDGYFGINQVAMLGDRDDPLLFVSGPGPEESTPEGEAPPVGEAVHEMVLSKNQCLVAEDESSLGLGKCQSALLSSNDRGLFKINHEDQLQHVGSGKCVAVTTVNGEGEGEVELRDCKEDEGDGEFTWELTEKGQLKSKAGNYCLMPANSPKVEESATNATANTTSSQTGHPPSSAVDGDDTSYWSSGLDPAPDAPVELTVDLNSEKNVENIEIDWEYPAKSFDVQVAKDGAWTTIFSTASNNSMKTRILDSEFPKEIADRLGARKLPRDLKSVAESQEIPSPELPRNASAVRIVMKEPHPEFGVEKGHSVYGIRNIKINASGSKEMVVRDCDKAAEEAAEDKRDLWTLQAAVPVMGTARKKVEMAQINFL